MRATWDRPADVLRLDEPGLVRRSARSDRAGGAPRRRRGKHAERFRPASDQITHGPVEDHAARLQPENAIHLAHLFETMRDMHRRGPGMRASFAELVQKSR